MLVAVGALPEATRAALSQLQKHAGLRLVSASPVEVPAREQVLGAARRAYGKMEWKHAIADLQAAETRLIDGQPASAERVARLAELELFLGACLLLDRDRPGAEERFVLARTLKPAITVDAIFPPEVAQAFASTKRPPAAIPVEVQLTPPDARLSIDGAPAEGPSKLTPGLHYVVVERGDRRPVGRVVRVSKASAKLELAASAPASAEAALAALSAPTVSDPEGLGISRIVGGPVWRIAPSGAGLEARRWSAQDPVRPTSTATAPADDVGAIERAICAVDRCDPVVVAAPPASKAKPVWKRSWFWPVIGAGAAVIVGGVVAGAVVGTRPRDYEVVVR